jgi:aryl-alcohol dehydrogenase-like predicted oxidoreductase
LDTAEAYQNSEKVLGQVLDLQSRRHQLIIASKFGQNLPDGRTQYTPLDIEHALTKSLQNLQSTYIDLYQVSRSNLFNNP